MITTDFTFETVAPGLEIARGAVTDIAVEIHEELQQANLPWILGPDNVTYKYSLVSKQKLIEDVEENLPTLALFMNDTAFADLHSSGLNKQPPFTQQGAHEDSTVQNGVYIVHFSPEGAFDYRDTPDTTGMNFEERLAAQKAACRAPLRELPVSTGDVVRINDNSLMHRGRNPSAATRFNLVLANLLEFGELSNFHDGEE